MTSPAAIVAETARRWSRLHPELAPALARAVALVGGVEPVSDTEYLVSGVGGDYSVRIESRWPREHATCSCPAWQYSNRPTGRCKHVLAVALWRISTERTTQPKAAE